jgi:transcriptional regulator with XRE-family HTH domain
MDKIAFSKELGARVKHARLAKGLSQEQLADKAEYYRSYVGRVENGGIAVSVHTIWKLAKAMDVDLGDLLKGL